MAASAWRQRLGSAASAWRRNPRRSLREAAIATAVIAGILIAAGLIAGLVFVWPIEQALHARGTAAAQDLVGPVIGGGIVAAVAGGQWLAAALRRPQASARYEIGASQRRDRRYQDRVGKLRVAVALLAYYVPAVIVNVSHHHGTSGLEDYFRDHLLDGFGFIGFLAIGWQLVTRDVHRAAERLTRSTALIAMAGAFAAGGNGPEIALAGFFSEVFYGRPWRRWVEAGQLGATDAPPDPRKDSDVRYLLDPPEGNVLLRGQQLHEHHCLQSGDGRYLLIMWDGQLAVWGPDDTKPAWTTGTGGSGASYAALDDSGRLTLYGADQVLIAWQSPVAGGAATSLQLENDGTLAAYRADGRKVWGTAPPPAEYKRFTFEISPPVLAAPSL